MAGSTESEKWHIIYPQYINSNRSLYYGRRLGKNQCVSDPKCAEIKDVLEANHSFVVQINTNKCYSREVDKESAVNRGYVKYQVVKGSEQEFGNKKAVLKYVSQMIPKLKSRNKPNQNESQPNTNQANTNKKKKGKK